MNSELVFLNLYGAQDRCQGINSASLCSLAGRYDNPIPTRCLAPIDFLKIPALLAYVAWARIFKRSCSPGIHSKEWILPPYVAWARIFPRLWSPGIYCKEWMPAYVAWARNFKRLWSPGIDSKEWILPAYVAWRAGTINLYIPPRFLAPKDCLKIPALRWRM